MPMSRASVAVMSGALMTPMTPMTLMTFMTFMMLMSGCRDFSTNPRTTPPSAAHSIVALAPLEQDAIAGAGVRLSVKVLDLHNQPLPDLTVVFSGPTRANAAYRMPVSTDRNGNAYADWMLPTRAASYTVAAIVSASLQVSFQERVKPGAPTQLVATTVLTQAAAAGGTLYPGVVVQDGFQNTVPGAAVSFTLGGPPGGSVEQGDAVANDSGFASPGAWTIGTDAGTYTLRAVAGSSASQGLLATIVFGARVNPTFAVTALVAGEHGGCAIAARAPSGTYCWGNGFDPSRLGLPGTNDSLPLAIANAPMLVSLAVGDVHACGLTNDATAYCWGNNSRGQVGNPDGGGVAVTPVEGQHQFRQLVAGREFTCGLALDGATWCWGDNSFGQLGDSTGKSSGIPVRVAGSHVFASLTGGDQHACGLTAAGVAWCWGRNDSGQVGAVAPPVCGDSTGDFYFGGYDKFTVSCALAPVQAVAPPLASISASADTCGLGVDGTVVCWGIPDQPQPLHYVATEPLIQIATTGTNVCALARSGAVYCTDGGTPLVRAGPSVAVRFITAGLGHQCAIGNDGIAYCWGANDTGQLGNGTHAPSTIALPVAAP